LTNALFQFKICFLGKKNRDIAILPYMEEIYDNRKTFFDNSYELVSNEVWQIFDNFEEVDILKLIAL